MKSKRFLCSAGAALALAVLLAVPQSSSGQAGASDEQLVATLLSEVAAQQKTIAENQVKVDEKVALVAEEVRLARIYSGRSGGKGGAK